MKKITLILITIIIGNIAKGQQVPMLSQYSQMPFIYNPAYTGFTGNTNAFLVDHSQWTDMPGGPVTRALTLDGSIQDNKAGLGAVIYNDITDITSRIGAYGSYSYKLKTSETTNLIFGLALGIIDNKIDYSKIVVKDANDLSLFGQSQNKTSFDGNAGVLFNWKKLEVGVSVPQLLGNKITYIDNYSHSVYQMSRHYMLSAKYTFDISKEQNIHFSPLALVRFIPDAPIQYDINALFDWKDIVGVGVTYKSNYAVTGSAYVKVHQSFLIGYAYDFIISNISSYAGTSHELLLGYTFGVKRKKELDEIKADIEELKKKDTDNTELKKQVADNKEQINKNTEGLNKTNLRVDSLKLDLDKVKSDLQKTNEKTDNLEKKLNDKTSSSKTPETKETPTVTPEKKTDTGSAPKKTTEIKTPEASDTNKISKPLKIGTEGADGVRTISKKDFKDKNGNPIKEGYYVVVGTFYYYDYAMAEIQRFINRGYANTSYIFYTPLHYHYLFIENVKTREEAIDLVKKVRAIQSDACVLNVTE